MTFAQSIGRLAKDDPAPKYLQLQRMLRNAIENHTLQEGDAIPTERDLAEDFDVSRITIRKAIEGLAGEGLLTRRQGAGTFVSARVEKSFSKLSSFSEDMIARGRVPSSEWVSKSEGLVTPEEAFLLGFSPGTVVYRFQRVRYADGQTMALEYSTIPASCLPSEKSVSTSLYEALTKTGNRPVRALQRLRAITFSKDQADRLGVSPGDAGLFIERRGFLKDGQTCEFTQSYYRGDAYDVIAELTDIH